MLTVKNVGVREIILNRPKKFNALNLNMVERITPEIQVYTCDEADNAGKSRRDLCIDDTFFGYRRGKSLI